MKNFITCFLLFVLSCQCVIALETIKTSSMSDSTNFPYVPYSASAVSGPYVISSGLYQNSSDWTLNIQKRNAAGYYAQIAQFQPCPPSISVTTNGKWFAAYFINNASAVVFQLTNDETISNVTQLSEPNADIKLLSDDSLLFIKEGNVTTYTYSNNGQWSISDVSTLQHFIVGDGPVGLVHVTDNTIAYVGDDATAYLYNRQNDKSWQLRSSILISNDTSLPYNIAWNGDDTTLVCAFAMSDSEVGNISVYQLTGNSWNFIKNISGTDLRIQPIGFLGFTMTLLDKDTFIVTAPMDGALPAYVGGSAFIVQRKSGSWLAKARLESIAPELYGVAIGYNDMDILIYSCSIVEMGLEADCRQHVLKRCFDSPIDVTCKDVKLDSCNALSSVDFSTLYTINNPLCGTVDVDVQNLNVDSKSIKFGLEFSRSFTEPASCNAQVTCSNFGQIITSSAGQQLVNLLLTLFLISTALLI